MSCGNFIESLLMENISCIVLIEGLFLCSLLSIQPTKDAKPFPYKCVVCLTYFSGSFYIWLEHDRKAKFNINIPKSLIVLSTLFTCNSFSRIIEGKVHF